MPRGPVTRTKFALAIAMWLGVLAVPAAASADELDEFEAARQAYVSQSFATAVTRFEALVGGEIPRLTSRPLVVESRKYLAAAYLFVGRRQDAERQFERLLEDDPTYEVDPLAFPAEVVDTFAAVRTRVEARRRQREEEARLAEDAARRREAERLLRERERISRLVELAETERETTTHSRFIALLPFGVGQFQNGHDGAGTVFAITEGVLAATSVVTYLLHESIRSDVQPLPVGADEPVDRQNARLAATALRVSNWISTGLLVAMAVAGIVDAQIRFVPRVEHVRRRPLPPELRENGATESSATLVPIGDLGLGARVTF